MPRGISRVITVVCASACLLFVLSACSVAPGSGLSALEARAQFYSLLDDTQEAVGGAWENLDDGAARGCVIPIWIEGERYPGLRIGPAPQNIDDTVQAVVDAWGRLGYQVERTMIGDVSEVQGRNALDELIVFRASDAAMTLQGESECRPTDA
jgi:hypothetical protein